MTRMHTQQRGFSLIELMVVLFILTLIMGVVFSEIADLQRRYRTEETKLDISQEGREAMDMFARDLHNSGFPPARLFAAGVLMNPVTSDSRAAAGLVSISATEVIFEGDLEGDGTVRSVRYRLLPGAGGDCPCQLQRSVVAKVNDTPWSQASSYVTMLGTVVNSGGSGAGGPNGSRNIAGNSIMPDGSAVANNTLYAAYRPTPVFQAFTSAGIAVPLPQDIQTAPGQAAIGSIATLRLNLNVLGNTPDMRTHRRPVVTLSSHVRLKN
jgi:prepilin-type N-terminal cleavage/methylation domain-containing protein